jgi:hypothetical protein
MATPDAIIQSSRLFTLFLFLLMLVCLELGRRVGRRRAERDPEGWQAGTGVIEGAMFGLLGLMLGFTFSAAMSRIETRRQQVVAEANAIGTAYLRIDLLPEREQSAIRDAFRQYTDARLSAYELVTKDFSAARAELDRAVVLQDEIWRATVRAAQESGTSSATRLLLPAVNEMIDITSVRTMAARTHNPPMFYMLIGCLLIVSSLLAGYAMSRSRERNWLHILGFAFVTTAVVYVIIDVDYPRIGFFRMDAADQSLYEVRAAMK